MGPPGPSTNTSLNRTGVRRLRPGGVNKHPVRRRPPPSALITDGYAADDHAYSIAPSSRTLAPIVPRSVHSRQFSAGEIEAVQGVPRLVGVHDQQRDTVRIPGGGDLTRQPDPISAWLSVSTSHTSNSSLPRRSCTTSNRHHRPPARTQRLQPLTGPVPLLRDDVAVRRTQYPQRGVPAVAMLGMRDRQQSSSRDNAADTRHRACSYRRPRQAHQPRSTRSWSRHRSPRPTAMTRRPTANPAGYPACVPGMADSASSLSTERLAHPHPNSSPPVSSNHQIHSPSGLMVPACPLGRSVTCRCSDRAVPRVDLPHPAGIGGIDVPVLSIPSPLRQGNPSTR